jgi:DNA-binding response OmpR family regulator
VRAELELAASDDQRPDVGLLLDDLRAALDLLGEVESISLHVVRVLVIDDDERLGELTARGLRRRGYDADASPSLRPLRTHEVVVLDLGVSASLSGPERDAVRAAHPIIVTGPADPSSRALAEDFGATDYLVKPVDIEALVAAIERRNAQRG